MSPEVSQLTIGDMALTQFTYEILRTLSMMFLISWLLFSITIFRNITLQFDVCDCYGD